MLPTRKNQNAVTLPGLSFPARRLKNPPPGGGGSNPNPPSVVTATPSPTLTPVPTSTPLPISDKPTENPTKNAPSEVTPTPTTEPVITSSGNDGATEGENDWEDVCTFDLCLGLTVACYWDGGTPEIVEDGSGNTGVRCTIPDADDGAATPFPWGPVGITGLFVVLMVMLLPAIQKLKNKPDTSQTTADYLLTLDGIPGESKDKMPNNKNPELVKNKDNEPKAPFIHFGDIDGEAHPHDNTPNEIKSDGKKKKIRRPTTGGGGGLSVPDF